MSWRAGVAPAPTRGELEGLLLHEVLRDWPETLAPLRRHGVDVAAGGGGKLGDLPEGEVLVRLVEEATSWRRGREGKP